MKNEEAHGDEALGDEAHWGRSTLGRFLRCCEAKTQEPSLCALFPLAIERTRGRFPSAGFAATRKPSPLCFVPVVLRPRCASLRILRKEASQILLEIGKFMIYYFCYEPPSSSGPGHSPLKATTWIRIPLEVLQNRSIDRFFAFKETLINVPLGPVACSHRMVTEGTVPNGIYLISVFQTFYNLFLIFPSGYSYLDDVR